MSFFDTLVPLTALTDSTQESMEGRVPEIHVIKFQKIVLKQESFPCLEVCIEASNRL